MTSGHYIDNWSIVRKRAWQPRLVFGQIMYWGLGLGGHFSVQFGKLFYFLGFDSNIQIVPGLGESEEGHFFKEFYSMGRDGQIIVIPKSAVDMSICISGEGIPE